MHRKGAATAHLMPGSSAEAAGALLASSQVAQQAARRPSPRSALLRGLGSQNADLKENTDTNLSSGAFPGTSKKNYREISQNHKSQSQSQAEAVDGGRNDDELDTDGSISGKPDTSDM